MGGSQQHVCINKGEGVIGYDNQIIDDNISAHHSIKSIQLPHHNHNNHQYTISIMLGTINNFSLLPVICFDGGSISNPLNKCI